MTSITVVIMRHHTEGYLGACRRRPRCDASQPIHCSSGPTKKLLPNQTQQPKGKEYSAGYCYSILDGSVRISSAGLGISPPCELAIHSLTSTYASLSNFELQLVGGGGVIILGHQSFIDFSNLISFIKFILVI